MRGYKEKIDAVQIPKSRIEELKAFCLDSSRSERDIIEAAACEASDSVMGAWIVRHVTSTDWPWRSMEAAGVPCGADTFRVYRARFFFLLNRKLEMIGKMTPL